MDIDYTRRNKKPRLLTDQEKDQLDEFVDAIHYSSRYAIIAAVVIGRCDADAAFVADTTTTSTNTATSSSLSRC